MNDGDDEREENCKTYFLRARKRISGLRDGFDNQFYAEGLKDIWQSFDAFLGRYFPKVNNKSMREEFSKDYQSKFENWEMSDDFKKSSTMLNLLCPIPNMSPINPGEDFKIKDINDLFQLLGASYRVRSNLTHGSKDLERQDEKGVRNRALVENSFKLTYAILEKVLIDKKIIE